MTARLTVPDGVLSRFIAACEERGADPSRQAAIMLVMWIDRIGYSEAVDRVRNEHK